MEKTEFFIFLFRILLFASEAMSIQGSGWVSFSTSDHARQTSRDRN